MSRYTNSNTKLYLISIITLAGSAFVAAGFVVPRAQDYAKRESTRYTVQAINGQGIEAALDYKLAASLDSKNEAAAIGLARVYLSQGQTIKAVELLERVGDNQDGLKLRAQTLTELGNYAKAKISVDRLASNGNDSDRVLAAAVYKLGGYNTELEALDSRLTSVEALQALSRIKAGQISEALELRALGLPVSAAALLVKIPLSTPRNIALGQLLLAKGDTASLSQAASYLVDGIKLDPANVDLRTTFADVLRAQNEPIAAQKQDKFVLRLRQGKF